MSEQKFQNHAGHAVTHVDDPRPEMDGANKAKRQRFLDGGYVEVDDFYDRGDGHIPGFETHDEMRAQQKADYTQMLEDAAKRPE